MDITVRRREGHVSERLRVFATHKLERLPRFMPTITSVDVELYEDGSPKATGAHVVELTVVTSGPVFRSKGTASDPRASIDMAVERLERRLKEFKRRRSGRPAHASSRPKAVSADTSPEGADEDRFSELAGFDIDDEVGDQAGYEVGDEAPDEVVELDIDPDRSSEITGGRGGGRGGPGGDDSD
jgi:ribosomal subunit interface protein